MRLTLENFAMILSTNVFKDITPLILLSIDNISELNQFLFINNNAYNINEYSYIIYRLFKEPISYKIFKDLFNVKNYMIINIPINILFKYGLLDGPGKTIKRIQKLIKKLNLVFNRDYTEIVKNNKIYHYINGLTFLQCLSISKYQNIIYNMEYTYNIYIKSIATYNKDYLPKFIEITNYFILKNNIEFYEL